MTDSPAHKQLVAWLNDAYAMEHSLAQVLRSHAADATPHPELQARGERHLEETRRHADEVARCLAFLGEKPSAVKGMMGTVMGKVQGVATGIFGDELMKNTLSDYAMEHFEIACYRSLIAAADEAGRPEIVKICEGILKEEEAMAAWLAQRLPDLARTTLRLAPAA